MVKALLFGALGLILAMGTTAHFVMKDIEASKLRDADAAAGAATDPVVAQPTAPADGTAAQDPDIIETGPASPAEIDAQSQVQEPASGSDSSAASLLSSFQTSRDACLAANEAGQQTACPAPPSGVSLVDESSDGYVAQASAGETELILRVQNGESCRSTSSEPQNCAAW